MLKLLCNVLKFSGRANAPNALPWLRACYSLKLLDIVQKMDPLRKLFAFSPLLVSQAGYGPEWNAQKFLSRVPSYHVRNR